MNSPITEQDMTTVLETLQGMKATFNPDTAKGVNAVIQLNASGDGGGNYSMHIADGAMDMKEGVAENPNVTINVAAKDWVDIIEGRLDPTKAFMTGKLKIAGDLGLMMRFQRMFMPG
jgi:putative sterol carrier protein